MMKREAAAHQYFLMEKTRDRGFEFMDERMDERMISSFSGVQPLYIIVFVSSCNKMSSFTASMSDCRSSGVIDRSRSLASSIVSSAAVMGNIYIKTQPQPQGSYC